MTDKTCLFFDAYFVHLNTATAFCKDVCGSFTDDRGSISYMVVPHANKENMYRIIFPTIPRSLDFTLDFRVHLEKYLKHHLPDSTPIVYGGSLVSAIEEADPQYRAPARPPVTGRKDGPALIQNLSEHGHLLPAGRKDDQDKLDFSLLPLDALPPIIRVLMYGAEKYSPDNWRTVPDPERRYYNAAMRHLTAWKRGETADTESGFPHLAHAACCLLFLLALSSQPLDGGPSR